MTIESLTGGPRPPRAGAVATTAAYTRRGLLKLRRVPEQLVDVTIGPVLLLVMFTYVFGGAISGSTGDYLAFALPGIIVQNALFGTLNTGVGLNTDLTKGVFDRLRALPIARWSPLAGRIVADMAKQAWAMALLLGLGAIMGFRVGDNGVLGVLGAFGLLLAFAIAFSWISVLVGLLVSEPDRVMVFGFAVMFPLTFVSNAFVPSDTMPGWLQGWVDVNPVTILADAIRGLLAGGEVAAPVGGALLWAAGVLVVFAPLAVRTFRKKV